MNDIAPIILAIGVLITAATSAYTAILALKAKLAAESAALLAAQTKVVIDSTHDAVNSKMDKLLAVTKIAARAEGVLEGKEQVKNGSVS